MLLFRTKTTFIPSLAVALAATVTSAVGEPPNDPKLKAPPRKIVWNRQNEAMVEVTKIDDTVFYELRYATDRNFVGKQIYPRLSRCLLRKSVAFRLKRAQTELRKKGYGLKIWDAYRPAWAQQTLWDYSPNPEFVGAPARGGSYHTWGVAVDVTLVDLAGREQRMPTDFDDFTPAAKSEYTGGDPVIAANVRLLRSAMLAAGFTGLRDEWWHFTAEDAAYFCPVDMPLEAGGKY